IFVEEAPSGNGNHATKCRHTLDYYEHQFASLGYDNKCCFKCDWTHFWCTAYLVFIERESEKARDSKCGGRIHGYIHCIPFWSFCNWKHSIHECTYDAFGC